MVNNMANEKNEIKNWHLITDVFGVGCSLTSIR